jgi:hypothetical protein
MTEVYDVERIFKLTNKGLVGGVTCTFSAWRLLS